MMMTAIFRRRRGRTAILLSIAALILAASAAVYSYVLEGPTWPSNFTTFKVNPNFPAGIPGTTAQQIEAFKCAGTAWHNQGRANINVVYQGTTGITNVNEGDGTNAIFYLNSNPGGSVIATTFYASFGGSFIGYDIVYWGLNDNGVISWNGVGDPVGNQVDLIAVATHEFGHAIGLDHTPVLGATMETFYNGVQGRTLHADDEAGIQFLYGFNPSISDDPVINDVDPPGGPPSGGNSVTLTGANFTWEANTTLKIDGVTVSQGLYELENCSTLAISSMPSHSPGPVSIQITNELGTVTLSDAYTYDSGTPLLLSVVPAAGPVIGGTAVTLIGEDFSSDATVFFGLNAMQSMQYISSTEIQGVTPPAGSAGAVTVSISQQGGTSALPDGFLYSDNLLSVESTTAPPGAQGAEVAVFGTHDLDLAGYSFGIDFDGEYLFVTEVDEVGTVMEGADFFLPNLDNTAGPDGSWWTLGAVLDTFLVDTIPAGAGHLFAISRFNVDPATPVGALLQHGLVNNIGDPPVELVFTPASGVSITPSTSDGLMIINEGSLFIRGDGNMSGVVDLADPIFNLAFQFSNGPATCFDALDTNDDGQVNIADPVYNLAFLFTNGPVPPEPFPGEGLDPTADGLTCD